MNVEYIVGFVKNKWDVDVPYVKEEIHWAANVEYLLKVVDYVNGKLNNGEKTNYGESEYATKEVVDTIAANQAIRTLIKKKKIEGGEFWYITDSSSAEIAVSGACGAFTVDWGDGTTETIDNRDEENADNCEIYVYRNYEDDVEQHKVTLRGNATKYAQERVRIAFDEDARYLTEIGGCLGCIFHTQADGSQPSFWNTFAKGRFTEIPDGFFDGIYGTGRERMFEDTFSDCKNLKSIPADLFSNITAGAPYMFAYTFAETGITEIPGNLFSNITTGAPKMFYMTFTNSGITEIPDKLFASIETGAEEMFSKTFGGCENLTTIGDDVFASIETGANRMFYETFAGCEKLTTIGDGMFASLETGAEWMFDETFEYCENLTTIGNGMFASLKTGAEGMFEGTFSESGITEIPDNMFASLTTGAEQMFELTFYGCEKLSTIGDDMFASLKTGAESMFYGTFLQAGITEVPDNLFASLETGANSMFYGTFSESGITEIPDNMFASLKTGAKRMFSHTFSGTGIREIPDNLFASLETGANSMFFETFAKCYDLTKVGNILPKLAGPEDYPESMFNSMFSGDEVLENTLRIGPGQKELWEMWPDVSEQQYTYSGVRQIPDYSSIPDVWK